MQAHYASEWSVVLVFDNDTVHAVLSGTVLLTKVAVIINKDDLVEKVSWCAVQDAVHSAEQGRECFIVKTNNDTGDRQVGWVGLFSASVMMRKCLNLKKLKTQGGFSIAYAVPSSSCFLTSQQQVFKIIFKTVWFVLRMFSGLLTIFPS